MQMWQSNTATVLYLLKPLALLIITISGEKYFGRSLFMSDISTVSTKNQIGLNKIVAWNTNISVP